VTINKTPAKAKARRKSKQTKLARVKADPGKASGGFKLTRKLTVTPRARKFAPVYKPVGGPPGGRAMAGIFYLLVLIPFLYYILVSGLKVSLAPQQVGAGEVAIIRLAGVSPWVKMELWQGEMRYPVFSTGLWQRVVMVPLPAGTASGSRELTLVRREGPLEWRRSIVVDVAEIEEEIQQLTMSSKKMALWKRRKIKREREELQEVLSAGPVEPMFQGEFSMPLEGRISTPYGVKRVLNKSTDYGYHRGLDLAAPQGTPVYAANAGWVVYARENTIGGNSVVINHGWGIRTLYFHLQRSLVSEGSQVLKGQAIGLVGTTGFSTGPHLHWGFYVHGKAVSGKRWVECETYQRVLRE
jgi:murein DD-endopeptidase MepM/ murein hydrolase activator NlpD